MTLIFVILIILACVILGLIILVQNPKGGGLAGNVGGFSNQLMGVKQTTDVLEKGTWMLAIIGMITVLIWCFLSQTKRLYGKDALISLLVLLIFDLTAGSISFLF